MLIVRDIGRLPAPLRGAGLALGNFDGVHPGHRAVIAAARQAGRPHGVISFEPHPRRLFRPDDPPFRLTPPAEKFRLLRALDLDLMVALRFSRAMASMPALQFIDRILVQGLGIGHLAVGEDFCFGQGRSGDVGLLQRDGRFSVSVVPAVGRDGQVYSSSLARQRLADGQPEAAAAVLGRPFRLTGRVRHGDKRGRTIGFPTANLGLTGYILPKFGVYAVQVAGIGPGVANLGRRPTVAGEIPRLEVHLFDYAGDLYGQRLSVDLIRFIRPERKFPSFEALRQQISEDSAAARLILQS